MTSCSRCGKPDPGHRHVSQCATLPEGVDPNTILFDVSTAGGKYRFIYYLDAKPPQAFRNGVPWAPFTEKMFGSNGIMSLVCRIADLESELQSLREEMISDGK